MKSDPIQMVLSSLANYIDNTVIWANPDKQVLMISEVADQLRVLGGDSIELNDQELDERMGVDYE